MGASVADQLLGGTELGDILDEAAFSHLCAEEIENQDALVALYTALAKQRRSTVAAIRANISEKGRVLEGGSDRDPSHADPAHRGDEQELLFALQAEVALNNAFLQQIRERSAAQMQRLAEYSEKMHVMAGLFELDGLDGVGDALEETCALIDAGQNHKRGR